MLAAEGAVVLNSFFIILRQLNAAASRCSEQDSATALRFLDSAVGIWLGAEQAEGRFNSGYMMYSMGQLAWNHFRNPEGEAPVNTELMDSFKKAKGILTKCTVQAAQSYADMRMEVKEIARLLSIPMVQELLYYIAAGDRNFEELFSVAFVPQIAACSAGDYSDIQDTLLAPRDNSFFSSSSGVQTVVLDDLAAGLACLGITCEDLGEVGNSEMEKLKTMVSSLCLRLNAQASSQFLSGYEVESGSLVVDDARLDLDIHQIDMLMRTDAMKAAEEIYSLGYNSRQGQGLQTLQQLSLEWGDPNAGSLAQEFSSYFGLSNYPNQFITEIFSGGGAYASASGVQKAAAVKRMLQAGLTYLAVTGLVGKANDACANDQSGEGFLDRAVALFVGSIEGARSGGRQGGVMLMGLGKEVCATFDNCETSGDASANEFVLFAFADMKQWLRSKHCASASTIKDETLLPMLAVPIIQATLMFAEKGDALPASSTDEALASLDVCARAILPQVDALNKTSATAISDSSKFARGQKAVPQGAGTVYDAFTYVVNEMDVDCDVVGTSVATGLSTCNEEKVAPVDTPTDLGTIYTSTTFVQNFADIAVDIKQMEDDLKLDRKTTADIIYRTGQNSAKYDKFGIKVDLLSLADLSLNASETMQNNPLFQITVFALKDASGQYFEKPAAQYADSVVQQMFAKDKPSTLPAEAAVSLNIWMEIVNRLYESVENCKNQMIVGDDGIHSMDIVAAYWIGDGQTAGKKEEGHLLYNLAERMAVKFGTMDESGQSSVNVNFLRLLKQARLDLSFAESCSSDFSTARKLTRTVNRIVSQMVVLQVQGLINAVLSNDRDRVKIFAHGFVPLVKVCNDYTYDYLNTRLVLGSFGGNEVDTIIGNIYSVLPCFEITCKDIGSNTEFESGAECQDLPGRPSLAGYRSSVDVAGFSALDLDISVIDVLMAQGAYEAAKNVYVFGKHLSAAGTTSTSAAPSLQGLARSTGRATAPDFNTFVQYYSGSNDYADSMVTRGFDAADLPIYQRRAMVVLGSQYLIMYMAIQEQLHESVAKCKAGGTNTAAAQVLWNKAGAYIIGSMEGTVNQPYPEREGTFLWGVSKRNCEAWGRCRDVSRGGTVVNERIRSLLYTGRGAVSANSCEALEKAANEMSSYLRAILIQAALSDLEAMNGEAEGDAKNLHHARAYVGAQSVLPLINEKNREDAGLISRNLDFEGTPLEDGFTSVAKAFTNSLEPLGIDCILVGNSGAVDFCTGEVSSGSLNTLMIVGVAVGIMLGAIVAVFVWKWRSKRKSGNAKNSDEPFFVRNTKGVLDGTDGGSNRNTSIGPIVELTSYQGQHDSQNESYSDAPLDRSSQKESHSSVPVDRRPQDGEDFEALDLPDPV